MKYRNCVYTMAAALLVACSLAVSGCSDKKPKSRRHLPFPMVWSIWRPL